MNVVVVPFLVAAYALSAAMVVAAVVGCAYLCVATWAGVRETIRRDSERKRRRPPWDRR